MKRAFIFLAIILAGSSCLFAQEGGNAVYLQGQATAPVTTVGVGMIAKGPGATVQGAPYSATITNENIQTLEDGTHIAQNSTGSIARDSQGRTRQDASLPPIGNLSAADAPHIVFIQDPVSQTAYTLNLTDKTAQKMPVLPPNLSTAGPASAGPGKFVMQMSDVPAGGPPPPGIVMQRTFIANNDQGQVNTEDLGSQTMEGVLVNGIRSTHTIPAGEIGNDKPITIVTEVWTSPDLKTIVYSKRTDPRMGQQTFQLTNIVRSEPDASLFTVPADFKLVDGPQRIMYRSNP
ncbi:MAG TPA: hypothetical protein VGP19_15470 [Candidatus Acidoferrales bacterium]|jgi:hypothetical protein|nr:hypothetical protein [Candidatus Acidoferrales bacterium]